MTHLIYACQAIREGGMEPRLSWLPGAIGLLAGLVAVVGECTRTESFSGLAWPETIRSELSRGVEAPDSNVKQPTAGASRILTPTPIINSASRANSHPSSLQFQHRCDNPSFVERRLSAISDRGPLDIMPLGVFVQFKDQSADQSAPPTSGADPRSNRPQNGVSPLRGQRGCPLCVRGQGGCPLCGETKGLGGHEFAFIGRSLFPGCVSFHPESGEDLTAEVGCRAAVTDLRGAKWGLSPFLGVGKWGLSPSGAAGGAVVVGSTVCIDGDSSVHVNESLVARSNTILVVTSSDFSGAVHEFELTIERRPAAVRQMTGFMVDSTSFQLRSGAPPQKNTAATITRSPSSPVRRAIGVCESEKRFVRPRISDFGFENRVTAGRLIFAGNHTAIYVDPDCDRLKSTAELRTIAGRIADAVGDDPARHNSRLSVLSLIEHDLHPVSDLDHDGRLSILITDLDCRSATSDVPVKGVVRGSDFLDEATAGFGDQLYLDCELPTADNELRALLSHELTHAAVYSWQREAMQSQNLSAKDAQELVPSWLHEALAHCVELRIEPNSANFAERLAAFSRSPGDSPIITDAGVVPFYVRRSGARAAATLFVADVLGDDRCLSVLLDSRTTPVERIEQLANSSFPRVLQRWGIRNAVACLDAVSTRDNAELCGVFRADVNKAPVIPERIEFVQAGELENKIRLRRSVRGTASLYLCVDDLSQDDEISVVSVVADPASEITVSSVARIGDEVTVRLLSEPEVDSVAETFQDKRTTVQLKPDLSLPKRPTSKRSDLRAELEETTF